MRSLRSPHQRLSIGTFILIGLIFGAASYGVATALYPLVRNRNPDPFVERVVEIAGIGLCHAAWLCYRLTGWPRNATHPGVLFVNLAYYPLLFLFIRRIAWNLRRKPIDDAPRCPLCEYDLTGNESGICPECGEIVARSDSPSKNADPRTQ